MELPSSLVINTIATLCRVYYEETAHLTCVILFLQAVNIMILTTILANLLSTGCAVLLVRRGPTPRLRLLTLVVGLASLSQTAAFLHAQGIWHSGTSVAQMHQLLVGALSLCALHLLSLEIRDRNLTDRKLRLTEYELEVMQSRAVSAPAILRPTAPPSQQMTIDLLNLFTAVNEGRGAAVIAPPPGHSSNLPAVRGSAQMMRKN